MKTELSRQRAYQGRTLESLSAGTWICICRYMDLPRIGQRGIRAAAESNWRLRQASRESETGWSLRSVLVGCSGPGRSTAKCEPHVSECGHP